MQDVPSRVSANKDDLKNIRMLGSMKDYNGNGDTKEGISAEIAGLREQLYTAIKAYAKEVSKKDIAYTAETNPYFFIDTNGNGQVDKDEAVSDNRYNAFTGRLAKAAYNYQVSVKDPGNFAHGGKYIIELLYDSTESLNAKITREGRSVEGGPRAMPATSPATPSRSDTGTRTRRPASWSRPAAPSATAPRA